MTRLLFLILVNTLFGAIVFVFHREGLLLEAWKNDILFIIPAISILLILGIVIMGRSMETAEWCGDAMITLGFIGTALGTWTAFAGVDTDAMGDIDAAKAVIANMITGLGAALWTTITGAFANLWLSANIRVMEAFDGAGRHD